MDQQEPNVWFILEVSGKLYLGGGSSTAPQVRAYTTLKRARSTRDRYFRQARILRVDTVSPELSAYVDE